VVQLQPHLAEFQAKQAALYVIGNGQPQFIEGFRETTGYGGAVYTDPSLEVFTKAQLVRSVIATLGLRSLANGIGTMRRGGRQGKVQGDTWQQGGALVIATDGKVLFQHQSTAGGDNVSAATLLSALAPQETAPPGSP